MDTVVVLRRCVNHPVTGDEYWEYWWEHPAGMFWNLDEVLCSLGVPDELLSDLLECLGPSSKLYRTLNNLAWSSSERVRLRVQVADGRPIGNPQLGGKAFPCPAMSICTCGALYALLRRMPYKQQFRQPRKLSRSGGVMAVGCSRGAPPRQRGARSRGGYPAGCTSNKHAVPGAGMAQLNS